MLTGLVVGKFCPLHHGHEALIHFARDRCDRLVILSYTKPDFPDCPTHRRAAWLAALFPSTISLVLDDIALAEFAAKSGEPARVLPHNDAPDEDHRAFVAWVCQRMLSLTVDRVFTSESYGVGFAEFLARSFGRPVEHISFDPGRHRWAISGTAIRADPARFRGHMPETVSCSLAKRVAVIGGESTGKTVLAEQIAERLGTCWVAEYGRELWQARQGRLRFPDMLHIAEKQIAREDSAIDEAQGLIICDTTPLVTAFYSEAMFGRVDARLTRLADRRYDHIFLCEADFPFVQDGTRRDDQFRSRQNEWYRASLSRHNISFSNLAGSLSRRVEMALAELARFSA